MNSLIVELAIGLVFVFAVFAALTSALTEAVARFFALRAETLLRGIRALVDGNTTGNLDEQALKQIWSPAPANPSPPTGGGGGSTASTSGTAEFTSREPPYTNRLLENAVIASQGHSDLMPVTTGRKLSLKEKRNLPSYLSSRAFARAVIAGVVPNAQGKTTLSEIGVAIESMKDSALKKSLQTLVANADNSVQTFRRSIEQWYDDHMDRVSGWYKRQIRWISLAIGAVLVLAFNANAISITRALYSDEALRDSVVTQAVEAADCGDKEPAECLREVRQEIQGLRAIGLPLGWTADPLCEPTGPTLAASTDCSFFERFGLADRTSDGWSDFRFLLVLLVGYALMVLALVPGARFWFDLISRLGSLRSSGPRPERT
jgi:hypothetical protein